MIISNESMKNRKRKSMDIKKASIEAFLSGEKIQDIIRIFNISYSTFKRWREKYFENESFDDLSNEYGGGPTKILNEYWKNRILKLLLKTADKYGFSDGLWTTKRIAILVKNKFNIEVSRITIWRMLKSSDFFYKSPEMTYNEGSEDELNKWLKEVFPEILKKVRKYKGILYFLDESNIKLSAVKGKTWAPKGKRTKIKVSGKKGSISAISAISGSGYLVFNVYDSTISATEVEEFIKYMLEHHKRRHIFILMDNASVHKAKIIKKLEEDNPRLHIENLPPYWPKYNPDEYVWNYLKNVELKVYSAKSKSQLMKKVVMAMENISSCQKTIKGIFMRCPLIHHFI